MAFPIVTVLGAAAGLGQGIFSGIAGNAAAAAKNRAMQHQWDMQKMMAAGQAKIDGLKAEAQWSWDMARAAELRSVETQNAIDQEEYGAQLIDNAIRNMEINSEALFDRFVTEENLRGTQDSLQYDYAQTKGAAEAGLQAAQYMRQINSNALASTAAVQKAQNASVDLQESLLLDQEKDYLKYNVEALTAIAQDAQTKARIGVRQGMGNTSKRLAMESGRRLGDLYAQLDVRSKERSSKMNTLNRYMNTELATSLGQLALETEDAAQRLNFTTDRYKADYALAASQLEKLTIPSYDLSANQYKREMQSLQLQTDQAFQEATKGYRMQTIHDPNKPIPGLAPVVMPPTKVQGPSTGSIIASSLMAGVKGALGGYEGNETWG